MGIIGTAMLHHDECEVCGGPIASTGGPRRYISQEDCIQYTSGRQGGNEDRSVKLRAKPPTTQKQ